VAYEHALDLRYGPGKKTVLYLLNMSRFKARITKETLQRVFRGRRPDVVDNLLQDLSRANENSEYPHIEFGSGSGSCLYDSIVALYLSKEAWDFEICINGPNPAERYSIKCHAWIVSSRWPYFAQMVKSGLRESQKSQLILPEPGCDGGMYPAVLEAIMGLVYFNLLPDAAKARFTLETAINVFKIYDLYLAPLPSSTTNSEITPTVLPTDEHLFSHLLQFAEHVLNSHLTWEACIATYVTAQDIGAVEVMERALQAIRVNLKQIVKNPAQKAKLMKLPVPVLLELLFDAVAAT
jgi:hypothetical protein